MDRLRKGQEGLSLVEMMAALFVFGLITIGIAPLIGSSLQASNTARSLTVGKNLVQRSMERLRGLPYYQRVKNSAGEDLRVDLLDLYYPSASDNGYSAGVYTTTCVSGTTNYACPDTLPAGYQMVYRAEFVQPTDTDPEDYVVVEPDPLYAWDATSTEKDLPPSRLVRMTITGSWSVGGRTREYTLTSILGERKPAREKILGSSRVDYVVRASTRYVDDLGRTSEIVGVAGSSDSRVEVRLIGQADQATSGGLVTLTRVSDDPAVNATSLGSIQGAETILHAPPDADPAGAASKVEQTLSHPDLVIPVGFIGPSHTENMRIKASRDLPLAAGEFDVNETLGPYAFWIQPDIDLESPLKGLDTTDKVFSIKPQGGQFLEGATSAMTDTTSSTDRLVTSAGSRFGKADLFPVTFINDPAASGDKAVVTIKNFRADVRCESTLTGDSPTATYSAELKYWKEDHPNDGSNAGLYISVPLTGTNTTDPLKALQELVRNNDPTTVNPDATDANGNLLINNPMVREDVASALPEGSDLDMYLFPVTHEHDVAGVVVKHVHRGFIETWASLTNLSTVGTTVEEGGRVTRARVDGAIQIATRAAEPERPETALTIQIGKLSCEASDRR